MEKKMDEIKVCYPAIVVTQKNLPGFKATRKEDFVIIEGSEGHLLFHGMFLCKKTESAVLFHNKASKMLQYTGALRGRPICADCEKEYKKDCFFAKEA